MPSDFKQSWFLQNYYRYLKIPLPLRCSGVSKRTLLKNLYRFNPIKVGPRKLHQRAGEGGAIIPHLGHLRKDTFGPYFDNWAMGYENMVHY